MTSAPPTVAALTRAVARASRRIGPFVRHTALDRCAALGSGLHLKREDQQLTGSFKIRGALNAVLALAAPVRRRGIVAASTGNHGLALAEAFRITDSSGTIVVPSTIDPAKRARLVAAGATLLVHGADSVEAEVEARRLAHDTGRRYVSPYNDADVIAGQGTIGREIVDELPEVDAVFVAVGGGGLAAGVAAAVKNRCPRARVIGCLPAHSPVMSRSIAARRILGSDELALKRTLSDATAGGIEAGAITFALCRELIDEFIEVTEREIEDALADLLFGAHAVVEGAAGVAFAGWRRSHSSRASHRKENSVVILCGGNVDAAVIRRVVQRGPGSGNPSSDGRRRLPRT